MKPRIAWDVPRRMWACYGRLTVAFGDSPQAAYHVWVHSVK